MPIIHSEYRRPSWFKGRHLQTIMPALFRRVEGVVVQRERMATKDHDFIDVDWSLKGNKKLVILSHGLEGNSRQPYILGMTKIFNEAGWDTISWNFRGCSGEINDKVGFYHAGSSEDLAVVIEHAHNRRMYQQIVLVGFSLGGCMTLKLLGEYSHKLPSEITHAMVFSVPCDLNACIKEISSTPFNVAVYQYRFLTSLKDKLTQKIAQYPDLLGHIDLDQIQSIEDFDNVFTSPLCGFQDAEDYYRKCSCNQFIPEIHIPTLIVNAQNDPLLHPEAHPIKECRDHKHVFLEMPSEGGHVGFVQTTLHGSHWSEQRALEFLKAS
jgi:uncharacterized protein